MCAEIYAEEALAKMRFTKQRVQVIEEIRSTLSLKKAQPVIVVVDESIDGTKRAGNAMCRLKGWVTQGKLQKII